MIGLLHRSAYGLSLAGVAAGIAALVICAVVLVEICLRTFFATSTFMSEELVSYLVAAMCFLPLGYAFANGSMLRVKVLIEPLRNRPRARLLLELVCVALSLAVLGLLLHYVWINVARQIGRGYVSGTVSGIPQWIPTASMLIGIAILWFQILVYGIELVFGRTAYVDDAVSDEFAD